MTPDCKTCEHFLLSAALGRHTAYDLCGHPDLRIEGYPVIAAGAARRLKSLCGEDGRLYDRSKFFPPPGAA